MALQKRSSLLTVLFCLTLCSLAAQLSFFAIHSHVAMLMDSFVGSAIPSHLFHWAILFPLLQFIGLQIGAYVLMIGFIWFITVSCSDLFHCSNYGLGVIFWLLVNWTLFLLNFHYFPASFFAAWFGKLPQAEILLKISLATLLFFTLLAYYQVFRQRQRFFLGLTFLMFAVVLVFAGQLENRASRAVYRLSGTAAKPNIIIIGLDSLRPDYTGYFGNMAIRTPAIDGFLKNAVAFSEVYTPLARTFPAWVGILTAKHPKHSQARINLDAAGPILANDTLAKRLKAADYETFYATDEKRFSNITAAYGFDQVKGPKMGLNDFILGSLSDFPLTNLLVHSSLGHFLFPYNYANRAEAITYEPDQFLKLVQRGLRQRQGKPLFLAVHFCVSHWPFTWAKDHQGPDFMMAKRYQSSVERADKQFASMMQILKENGLLENSLLIVLSDHGTSLGLPGDRFLEKKNYQGGPKRLNWVTLNRLSRPKGVGIDLKDNYSLNTAYGQGTEVLSLKQYQVLLAFQYFGNKGRFPSLFPPHLVSVRASLLDLAPTILTFLRLPPMKGVDGVNLLPYLSNPFKTERKPRPLYLETGYSLSEIETDKIEVEKVLSHTIQLYQVNPKNGYLSVKPSAKPAVLENKQRAILLGPWLLARYPATQRMRLVRPEGKLRSEMYFQPAYYLLANLKTGQWTVGLDSSFAKQAPRTALLKSFKDFYAGELGS